MFDVEKGSLDDLEAKVLIYAKCLNPSGYKAVVIEDVNGFIGDEIDSCAFSQEMIYQEIMGFDGIVINAGEGTCCGKTNMKLDDAVEMYIGEYEDRLLRKIQKEDLPVEKSVTKIPRKRNIPKKTYENYSPEEIKSKIYNLSGRLIDLRMNESSKDAVIKQLKTLFPNPPYYRYIKSIIKIAVNEGTEGVKKIEDRVNLIYRLIGAVRKEKYEDAASFRDKLRSLQAKT